MEMTNLPEPAIRRDVSNAFEDPFVASISPWDDNVDAHMQWYDSIFYASIMAIPPSPTSTMTKVNDIAPTGLAFNNDGSKAHIVSSTMEYIHEYNLTNPYDLTSISPEIVTRPVVTVDTATFNATFLKNWSTAYMIGPQLTFFVKPIL